MNTYMHQSITGLYTLTLQKEEIQNLQDCIQESSSPAWAECSAQEALELICRHGLTYTETGNASNTDLAQVLSDATRQFQAKLTQYTEEARALSAEESYESQLEQLSDQLVSESKRWDVLKPTVVELEGNANEFTDIVAQYSHSFFSILTKKGRTVRTVRKMYDDISGQIFNILVESGGGWKCPSYRISVSGLDELVTVTRDHIRELQEFIDELHNENTPT